MGTRIRRLATGSAAAALLPLLCAASSAESVHAVRAGDDLVLGDIRAADEVDRLPVLLLDGTQVEVTLATPKGSALRVDLRILGPDGLPETGAAPAVKVDRK